MFDTTPFTKYLELTPPRPQTFTRLSSNSRKLGVETGDVTLDFSPRSTGNETGTHAIKLLDHVTLVLKYRHWLPVDQCIVLDILLFTDTTLNGIDPSYLDNLLKSYPSVGNLRSPLQTLEVVPYCTLKTYGEGLLSVCHLNSN